ncbi:MAG: HAMP domain-containing sensor histidine kinase [Aeromicrobium sp.]|uniref:sensor histidine kinase n=1 Tax=Aeromicrobium sp. TaxID=1871063 RepID=UPI0039E57E54
MRRLAPVSLTGRLVVTLVALVALVGVAVSALTTVTMRSYLTGRLDAELHQSLDRSTRSFGEERPAGRPDAGPFPVALGQGAGTLTAVIDGATRRGEVIGNGERTTLPASVLADLARVPADDDTHTVDLDGVGSYRVMAVETPDGLRIVAGLPTANVDDTISSLLLWEIALTLAGVVAAAGLGRVLVRQQLRPLREVAETAHEVAALPLSRGEVADTPRVAAHLAVPDSEVGRVGDALNTLLDHVETSLTARHESEQRVRQFVADASHELRTPLATISGYTELVRRSGGSEDVARQALAKIETESARMAALVGDLLLLARIDSGRPLEHCDVDLTRVVLEAVGDRQVVDPDRRWEIDLPSEPLEIVGDEGRLNQVLLNLLTNASRHTPEGTTVTTALRRDGDDVRLTVHDDGPGIDPDLLGHIFDRFVRGDSSRTRASGGAGLGTSLVKAIVEAHGGGVTVDSRPGSTTFTVRLPAGG